MQVNIDLMVETLAQIELAQVNGSHDQGHWGKIQVPIDVEFDPTAMDVVVDRVTGKPLGYGTCGTAFCAAGWALTIAGVKMTWTDHGAGLFAADYTESGQTPDEHAADLLGIPRNYQAATGSEEDDYCDEFVDHFNQNEGYPRMFNYNNTIEDVYDEAFFWITQSEDQGGIESVDDLKARAQAKSLELVAAWSPVSAS